MKNRFLLLIFSLCLSISSYSQDDLPYFSRFQIGIHAGSSQILGEVKSSSGFGFGINLAKALSPRFALRSTLSANQMSGVDYFFTTSTVFQNRAIADRGYSFFVNNYETQLFDVDVVYAFTAGVDNLGFYVGVGPNYHLYRVHYDGTDAAGNLHDFTALQTAISNRGDFSEEDYEIINNILDGEYETSISTDKLFEKTNSLGLSVHLGMNYHLKNNLSIGFQTKYVRSLLDNLDGFSDRTAKGRDEYLNVSVVACYDFY